MENSNNFYTVYFDKSKSIHEFDLFDIGNQQISCISPQIGNLKSEFTYRQTNQEDYDKEFYKKILSINPVYKVIDFLDYHFNNYCIKNNDKELFLTHIQYIIMPRFGIIKHNKPFDELIIKWLENKRKMKKKIRTEPTPLMKKKLQAEIESICPICSNKDVETFEFHHIDGDRSNTIETNLIMICPTCHSKIDKGLISKHEIEVVKINLPRKTKKDISSTNFAINESTLNNPVIGNNNIVNIVVKKQITKKNIEKYPEGSIGRDVVMYGYAKYLADRYAEYRNYDLKAKNEKFDYQSFYGKIKKDFKSGGIFQTPQSRFIELVEYLQNKIDKTILAKINKSKGILKNYDCFEDYKLLNSPH